MFQSAPLRRANGDGEGHRTHGSTEQKIVPVRVKSAEIYLQNKWCRACHGLASLLPIKMTKRPFSAHISPASGTIGPSAEHSDWPLPVSYHLHLSPRRSLQI